MDAPGHFYSGMKKIGDYPLDRLIMEAVVLDCRAGALADGPIDLKLIKKRLGEGALKGKALLLETGWSDYWGREEYFHHPFLGKEAVELIIDQEPLLVGIDVLVIDDRREKKRPAHCGFLGNEILIVENLTNLALIRDKEVEAYFIPLKIEDVVSMPIRAFAREVRTVSDSAILG
jgi:kynurenine formamidase